MISFQDALSALLLTLITIPVVIWLLWWAIAFGTLYTP